jgi:hypothetical protein
VYQGATLTSVTGTSYSVSGLTASTAYSFTVKKDAAGNVSSSNTANVTTTASAGVGASDLLFSEYIEGSSNNKALEISDATGSAVNLSVYAVKKNKQTVQVRGFRNHFKRNIEQK